MLSCFFYREMKKSNKFVLRIQPVTGNNNHDETTVERNTMKRKHPTPSSKAEATVRRKRLNERATQLNDAVAWCQTHSKTGYQAIKTGKFKLIKSYKTINKRLTGSVVTDQERAY